MVIIMGDAGYNIRTPQQQPQPTIPDQESRRKMRPVYSIYHPAAAAAAATHNGTE